MILCRVSLVFRHARWELPPCRPRLSQVFVVVVLVLRIPSANPVNSAFFAEQVILEASFEREFRSHGLRQTVFQTEGGPENDLSAPNGRHHKPSLSPFVSSERRCKPRSTYTQYKLKLGVFIQIRSPERGWAFPCATWIIQSLHSWQSSVAYEYDSSVYPSSYKQGAWTSHTCHSVQSMLKWSVDNCQPRRRQNKALPGAR